MNIELKIIEKLRGYLVVEFENKYFRLCNFTYENNKNWDLMELLPDTFTMDYDNIKIMNKKIYKNGSFDAFHLGTYKTKKEGLKSLFNYILRNYNN
jgi:hypothetical protein